MGENVEEGSILVTDSCRPYNGLDARFTHVKVKYETKGGYGSLCLATQPCNEKKLVSPQ